MLVSYFFQNIFRSWLTLVSSNDIITIKTDNKKPQENKEFLEKNIIFKCSLFKECVKTIIISSVMFIGTPCIVLEYNIVLLLQRLNRQISVIDGRLKMEGPHCTLYTDVLLNMTYIPLSIYMHQGVEIL